MTRLLISSATAGDRRRHTTTILRHYHDSLRQLFGGEPPFNFEQVLDAYEKHFKFGAIAIFPMLPMMAKMEELLGDNPEERKEEMLQRTQALIDDAIAIEEAL